MTTPNTELAYKVLDHIDAHPEQWDQALWWHTERADSRCGTAGCFAGWAVALSGGQIATQVSEYEIRASVVADGLGELNGMPVPLAAVKLLGITLEDEDEEIEAEDLPLFSAGNDREDLGYYVEEIFGPRPETTP